MKINRSWDPSILFNKQAYGSDVHGAYYNLTVDNTVFSNVAGTVAAVQDGYIRLIKDLSENNLNAYQDEISDGYCPKFGFNPKRCVNNGLPNDFTKKSSLKINLTPSKTYYAAFVTYSGIIFNEYSLNADGSFQLPATTYDRMSLGTQTFSLTNPDFTSMIIRNYPFSNLEKETIGYFFRDQVSPYYNYSKDDLFRITFRSSGAKTFSFSGTNVGATFIYNGVTYNDSFSQTVQVGERLIVRAANPQNITDCNFSSKGINLQFTPKSLNKLTSATQIYFSTNNLGGSGLPDISNCSALSLLRFNSCSLSGKFPSVQGLTNLTQIQCNQNSFSGNLPDISTCTSLTTMLFLYNSFSGWDGGTIPATCKNIQLSNNNLKQATVDAILAALVANGATNGTLLLNNYSGAAGYNEEPSPAGFANKDILVSRGWSVSLPFNPADISGLRLYLNADFKTTIVTGVSQWDDLSGQGNHVTQGTTANQPALISNWRNGKKAIQGDGINDYLSRTTFTGGAISQPSTIISVVEWPTGQKAFIDGATARQMQYTETAAQPAAFAGGFSNLVFSGVAGVASIMITEFNATSSYIKLIQNQNTTREGTVSIGTNGMNGVVIGGTSALAALNNKPAALFLVYNRLLTTDEKTALEQWIRNYYDIN